MKLKGLGTSCDDKTLNEFIENNFINQNEHIPNYLRYDAIVLGSDKIDYDKEILSLPDIDKLEKENKKSEFIYKFNEQIISRQKVLRVSSILYNKYHELTKEMLLYSITKGSYINEEVLDDIENNISYSYEGGKTHGLS